MALEYVLYSSAEVTTREVLPFLVDTIGAEALGTYARRDALDITPDEEDPDDDTPIADALGFTSRMTITYRLSNLATPEARDEATTATIRSVLTFFDRYGSDGALLFNDSRVILQRVGGPVVLDRDWPDWTEVPGIAALVAGLPSRPLPQPLL